MLIVLVELICLKNRIQNMKIKRLKIFIVIGLAGCSTIGGKSAQDDFRHFDPPVTKYQGSSFKEV